MSQSPSPTRRSPSPYLTQQESNNITIQTDDVREKGHGYSLNRPSGEKGSDRKKRRRTMTTNKTLNEQPSTLKKSSYQLPKSLRVSVNLQQHSTSNQSRYYRESKFFKESASHMHQIHSRFIPKLLDEKNIVLTKQLMEKRVDNAYEMFLKRQHKLAQYYNQNIDQYHTAINT